MNMERSILKRDARETIMTSKSRVMMVSLLYVALSVIITSLTTRVLYSNVSSADIDRYTQLVREGSFDYAMEYLTRLAPSNLAKGIQIMLTAVMDVVAVGYVIFLLNTVRKADAVVGNLLDGFGMFFRVIVMNIVQTLLITLWGFAFIIPGIVVAYSYSMTVYLLVDHPELSPIQCLKASRRMMKGHKWEFFKLDLSFILWRLAEAVPIIGYAVKTVSVPYIGMTKALYYERLCAAQANPDADFTDWI